MSETRVYTLENASGMKVKITNVGGIIMEIWTQDRDGNLADINLGFDQPEDYLKPNPYFGALIGRYGNRIALGKFTLDGETYTLAQNNGTNNLHGGDAGFNMKIWDAEPFTNERGQGLKLSYTSPHMEEGFPGELKMTVSYLLTEKNELFIDYRGATDRPTVVNMTQHAYFNLKGHDAGDICSHELMVNAELFTPVDSNLIPTGEVLKVADTPFDFREAKLIGQDIDAEDEQLALGGGYDHNYVLTIKPESCAYAAVAYEPSTGRSIEVSTTEPGMQLYTGNSLDGVAGKGGTVYQPRGGFCLETQHFPDSPNQGHFPTTRLNPGQEYRSVTCYKFGVK